MEEAVDEIEFRNHAGRKIKGIQIRLPQRAIHAVLGKSEWPPLGHELFSRRVVRIKVYFRLMFIARPARHPHAEAADRGERVNDMEKMGKGFREILPRMHRGIGGNIFISRSCSDLVVMPLHRVFVRYAFIAKEVPEPIYLLCSRDEARPIIMANLMAEVPKKRAIGFSEARPHPLALNVVCLQNIEGDQPILMSGGNLDGPRFFAHWIVKEIEGEPRCCSRSKGFCLRLKRKTHVQQRMKHSALGCFNFRPTFRDGGAKKVGDDAIMPACETERLVANSRDEPVAHGMGVVVQADNDVVR